MTWWKRQGDLRLGGQPEIQEGLGAYAEKQAAILEEMGFHFADKWYPILVAHGLATEWPEESLERWAGHQVLGIEVETVVDDTDDALYLEEDIFD